MKTTNNFDLPILESGDKYSKDIQNEAFNRIDSELYGITETLKSINNNVNGGNLILGQKTNISSEILLTDKGTCIGVEYETERVYIKKSDGTKFYLD